MSGDSNYPDGVTAQMIDDLSPSEWPCHSCGETITDSDESFEYMGESVCKECWDEIGDNQ
tara:strand:+ start:33147 stop:33326 length:180 start_codon:yes stop_codon:yes gene_type:complete